MTAAHTQAGLATTAPPAHLVFVFGTLKEGFPNFKVSQGTRIGDSYLTVDRLPLYLIGDRYSPWLIHSPGHGERVAGQVFAVTDAALEQMDVLERTHAADGYRRRRISVVSTTHLAEGPLVVFAYLKDPGDLIASAIRVGPLAEYTLEHAGWYRPRATA